MSRYPLLTRKLLKIVDPEEFEKEVIHLSQNGVIDREYVDWLSDCVEGKTGCGIDSRLLRLLHDELRRLVWIAPEIPENVARYYEKKISETLDPANVHVLKKVLTDMKAKDLLTMEFCHMFHHALDVRVDKREIDLLTANNCWDILLEIAGPAMAKEVDF